MNNTANTFMEKCQIGQGNTLFIIKKYPSEKHVVGQTVYCAVTSLLIIPTVMLNGVSALTITRNAHLKRKLCHFLILIQSFVDMVVGIISLPLYIFNAASELNGAATCAVFVSLDSVASIPLIVSFMASGLLTLERYMCILHPIAHRSYLTKTRNVMAVYCFIVGISVVSGPLLRIVQENVQMILQITLVLILLISNALAYARIYNSVKNLHFAKDTINDCSTPRSFPESADKRKSLRERKLAQSCVLVVIISCFCYIPVSICYPYFKGDFVNFRLAMCWCTFVTALASSFNSLVFFWKRPLLREEALKLLRKMYSQ